MEPATSSVVRPGATRPGHRTTHGTRMPPSQVVAFAPRRGSLLPPSTPREPLSLVKITTVSRSRPSSPNSCTIAAVAQSIAATAAP